MVKCIVLLWCVMVLLGSINLYSMVVGGKFVKCVRLIEFLVWLCCVSILFFFVISGNMCFGLMIDCVLVFVVMVVWMVVM